MLIEFPNVTVLIKIFFLHQLGPANGENIDYNGVCGRRGSLRSYKTTKGCLQVRFSSSLYFSRNFSRFALSAIFTDKS